MFSVSVVCLFQKSVSAVPTGWKGTNFAHVEKDAMKKPTIDGLSDEII